MCVWVAPIRLSRLNYNIDWLIDWFKRILFRETYLAFLWPPHPDPVISRASMWLYYAYFSLTWIPQIFGDKKNLLYLDFASLGFSYPFLEVLDSNYLCSSVKNVLKSILKVLGETVTCPTGRRVETSLKTRKDHPSLSVIISLVHRFFCIN